MGKKNVLGKRTVVIGIISVFVLVYVLMFVKFGFLFKKADIEDSPPIFCENSLYYNNLTRKEQLLYEAMTDAISDFDSFTREIPYRYSSDEFNDVVKFIICDNPMLFYVSYDSSVMYTNDIATKVELKYTVEREDAIEMRNALDTELERIAALLMKEDAFATELAIHDYLVENCAYLSDDASADYLNNTAYGAIINHKSYCDGYALAFKELMNRCGLFASTVCGTANGLNHMWDIVCIDDSFYHVDVTWDDADNDMIFHGYLNVSAEEISRTHRISYGDLLPEANNTKNYYKSAGLYAENAEQLSAIVNSAMRTSASDGKKYFEIMLGYDAEKDLRAAFSAAVDSINAEGKYSFTDAYREHYCSDDKKMINIEIYYEETK